MTAKRTLLILGIIVIGLPLAVGLLTRRVVEALPENEAAATAQVIPISNEPNSITLSASGQLQADEVANLSFLISGPVTDIAVAEGDHVTAGQPLIRLDGRQQYVAFEQANLSYGLTLMQYQDTQTVDDDDVRIAEANVASARSAYSAVAEAVSPEDITAAELQYQQALDALDGAQQARSVANPGVLGDEGIALLDAQVGESSFNAEIARLRLENLRTANQGDLGAASASIHQAQAALDQVKAGANSFAVEQAQNVIHQAIIVLDQAELNYNRTLLTAPFDGVITSVNVEIGQRVAAGTPIVQLVDISPLMLHAEINESDLPQVSEGMAAQVHLDALPDETFEGVVTTIAPKSRDSSGITVYDIDIQLHTDDPRLRPGMSADADLIVSN